MTLENQPLYLHQILFIGRLCRQLAKKLPLFSAKFGSSTAGSPAKSHQRDPHASGLYQVHDIAHDIWIKSLLVDFRKEIEKCIKHEDWSTNEKYKSLWTGTFGWVSSD